MCNRLRSLVCGVALGLAGVVLGAQNIAIPNTFTNGTVADATQVNANFTALAANAVNRTGGTFSGTPTPTADNTIDLGSAALRFATVYGYTGNWKGNTVLGDATADTVTVNGTITSDLIATDNTYDIGKSGATRFRDFFLARNAAVGGTLGVTGATSLSTLGVSGLSTVAAVTASGTVTPQGLVDASGASAGQVKFPATQNASANANTLDDYDERSWTPVIGGAGGTSGQTYTTQVGRSVKVGRQVTASFAVTLSAKGTITGAVQIQGLPYTADANVGASAGLPYYISLGTNWVSLGGYLFPSTTALAVYGNTAAAATVTALATADITNTTEIRGTVTYLTVN